MRASPIHRDKTTHLAPLFRLMQPKARGPMLRMLKYALIALCLGTASTLMAQAPRPSVEIVLNPPTAQKGQTITADVYVRGAVNIAGTDIGVTVDPACLRIVERQPGEFLPTEAEAGGFSAFSEQHDHDTRLAASLLQRSHIANGDGIFFRTTLEVLCESGVAPLNVSFAELTGIEDLEAENAKFVTYTLADDTVEAINAQLSVGPAGSVTAIPTRVPKTMPAAPAVVAQTQTQNLLLIGIGIVVLASIGLIVLLVVARRRSRRS
jgi:hypothetical protein